MPISSLLRPAPLFTLSALLRIVLLFYGIYQDAHSALKYTDIDYLVFTDAARYVSHSTSPYERETYRYTPLLAWLLVPTAWKVPGFFSSGKVLFAAADLLAGWFILKLLKLKHGPRHRQGNEGGGISEERAGAFAAIWLLNPMVATISTRGSSEGLLGLLTVALLWAVQTKRVSLAGILLGLAVHFKIYPFIYAPAIIWWMDDEHWAGVEKKTSAAPRRVSRTWSEALVRFCSPERIQLGVISLGTFASLNLLMYSIYGIPFLTHTYFHHVTRIDHRHNFSPYNTLLYLTSSAAAASIQNIDTSLLPESSSFHAESLAFLPQLLLSCVFIPLALAKKDLATSMMAQTFAFVTFNKVCTSQYFLWYLIFLPLHLPTSSLLRNPRKGIAALVLWIVGQAAWLQQGYELEFLGKSTFVPGLWVASLVFFLINCWILGVIIDDGAAAARPMGMVERRRGHKEHDE